MSSLYTHALDVLTSTGRSPSNQVFQEIVSACADSNFQQLLKAEQGIYWIAKSGMARLGLIANNEALRIVIGPCTNPAGALDFTSMYQALAARHTSHEFCFVLRSDNWSMQDSAQVQLNAYEISSQDLLGLVLNAIFDLNLKARPTSGYSDTHRLAQQRHMPRLFVQSNKFDHQDISPACLVEMCDALPQSFIVTAPGHSTSFEDLSVLKMLQDSEFKWEQVGDLHIWRKAGERAIMSACISEKAAQKLREARQQRHQVPVEKKNLPAWLTLVFDPAELFSVIQTIPLKSMTTQVPTGVAMQLNYPHSCIELYVTADAAPTSDEALYVPISLDAPLTGDVYTVSMLLSKHQEWKI